MRSIYALLISLALLSCITSAAFAAPTAPPPPGTTKVQGTVTQLEKHKITIRAGEKDYEIMLDGPKTQHNGHAAVDKPATVWYKKGPDGNLWAVRIDVPQSGAANPNANAADATTGSVEGQIAQWGEDKVTIRADGKEWIFMMDGKNTKTIGKPAVDKNATVWYKKFKGNLWATKIQVEK